MKAAGGASWRAQGTAELAGRGTPGTGTGGGARRGAPGQALATGRGGGAQAGRPRDRGGCRARGGVAGAGGGAAAGGPTRTPEQRTLGAGAPLGGKGGGSRRAVHSRVPGTRTPVVRVPLAPPIAAAHRGVQPRRGPRLVAACGSNGCQEMWDPTHDPARGARSPSCRKSSGRRAGWERTCCGGGGGRVVELPEPAEELEVPRRPSQKCPGAPGIFLSQH